MIFLATGVALLVLGGIAGLVGPKLGTALAVAPLVLWFVLLMGNEADGDLDPARGSALAACLGIGLLAFVTGSSISEYASSRWRAWHLVPGER